MENFIFQNPVKLIFGKDTISKIGKEIKSFGINKILLLAGSGSIKKNDVFNTACKSLKQEGIEWSELWGVRSNPSLTHALQGIEIIKKNNLEAVLAIGGGSVIDEAKTIAAGFFNDDLWLAFEKRQSIQKALPVFSILTLSGTGSEMNSNAVITNDETLQKWPVGGPALYPKVSIVDPSAQMSLPWEQTVNGAVDAISHVMEYYFLAKDEEITMSIDMSLISTIIWCVDNLKNKPDEYNFRANLAWSATLALNGISGAGLKGGDWAVHQIEHGLSALNNKIAHGAGLAVVYPAWIKYMHHHNPDTFYRWAVSVWNETRIDNAIEQMKEKYQQWGAPVSLHELGFAEEDIPAIAENVSQRGDIGVLAKLNKDDIINILKISY